MSGARSHLSGHAAEDQVARHYAARGDTVVARRWRGRAGEIDLVVRSGAALVFVEVKASASHARAAERLGPAQQARILRAAEEYVAAMMPDAASQEMRFDVALLDARGRIEIVENALGP
jgi:putative endonuclease